MNSLFDLKCVDEEGFEVQAEITTPDKTNEVIKQECRKNESIIRECNACIETLDKQIEMVTNYADGLDYGVAFLAGVLAGTINIFCVDDFSLEEARKWGDEKVSNHVVKSAKKNGYKKDDLKGAVNFLEDKFPIVADQATKEFGGGLQHHLRDFSHHPTPVGMFFSILTQFTHKVYGTDVKGCFMSVYIEDSDLIGHSISEKISLGVIQWFFHMVSDMAGSSNSILKGKRGTGLPGPLGSLLKEASALPFFRKVDERGYKVFSVKISKLFNGTLLGEYDENGKIIRPLEVDLRTEMGIGHQLGQQAIPVIINECIVRGFYFVRRFIKELKENKIHSIKELDKVNWKNTLPGKNRTITRMLTISTVIMFAINIGDAVIEAAVESGGIKNPAFLRGVVVKINYIGATRFVIAVGTDVWMGAKKNRIRREYNETMNRMISALNVKMYCKEAELMSKKSELYKREAEVLHAEKDMWIQVENTTEAMEELFARVNQVGECYAEKIEGINRNLDEIEQLMPRVEKRNRGLTKKMLRRLK